MGRKKKFQFIVRKNATRKKYPSSTALKVTINKSLLPLRNLSALRAQLSCFIQSSPWSLTTGRDEDGKQKIVLCYLEPDKVPPVIRYSVVMREDFTWILSAFGQLVDPQFCRVCRGTPSSLDSTDKVKRFLALIERCKICPGNMDEKFMEAAERRGGVFKDHSGKVNLVVQATNNDLKQYNHPGSTVVARVDYATNWLSRPTVRHSSCELLLDVKAGCERCQQCMKYRNSLHIFSTRLAMLSDDRLETSSHATYASLTSNEKDQRMKNLHDSLKRSEKQLRHWMDKLDSIVEERGVNYYSYNLQL